MSRRGVSVDAPELIRLRLLARNVGLERLRRTKASIAGQQQSRFRGRGVDFLESRGYQPGDDIRNMDWRVTARSGKPHTKVYQEERERPVIVMLDCNASMFFGSRVAFKSVVAARLAALIGWATVGHGDRIGAFLFGGGDHREVPPAGGRRGALSLINHLVKWTEPENRLTTEQTSPLAEALMRLRRVARPGSLVFILSDFYSVNEDSDNHLSRLRQHNDIIACQIVDTLELSPPPPGRYGITDGNTTQVLDTRSKAQRNQYQAHFHRHHERVRELTRTRNIPLLQLATHEDIVDGLRRMLASRGATA